MIEMLRRMWADKWRVEIGMTAHTAFDLEDETYFCYVCQHLPKSWHFEKRGIEMNPLLPMHEIVEQFTGRSVPEDNVNESECCYGSTPGKAVRLVYERLYGNE